MSDDEHDYEQAEAEAEDDDDDDEEDEDEDEDEAPPTGGKTGVKRKSNGDESEANKRQHV